MCSNKKGLSFSIVVFKKLREGGCALSVRGILHVQSNTGKLGVMQRNYYAASLLMVVGGGGI